MHCFTSTYVLLVLIYFACILSVNVYVCVCKDDDDGNKDTCPQFHRQSLNLVQTKM